MPLLPTDGQSGKCEGTTFSILKRIDASATEHIQSERINGVTFSILKRIDASATLSTASHTRQAY